MREPRAYTAEEVREMLLKKMRAYVHVCRESEGDSVDVDGRIWDAMNNPKDRLAEMLDTYIDERIRAALAKAEKESGT